MDDGVIADGFRFGAFRTMEYLPVQERLTECSRCTSFNRPLVQWRYCGTQGALCIPCLRQLLNKCYAVARQNLAERAQGQT